MCGIIGFVGNPGSDQLRRILIGGLERMEYRGYDSAGMAWLEEDGCIRVVKTQGKVADLDRALNGIPVKGCVGIAHTRWATHGPPSDINAHPHTDQPNRMAQIALVHNGIIDNASVLRERLRQEGREFVSETDTEVLAVLIGKFLEHGDDLVTAIQRTHALVKGAYAIVVLLKRGTGQLVAACHGSPLVVGVGEGCTFVASDRLAFVGTAKKTLFLEDDEMVILTADSYDHRTLANQQVERELVELRISLDAIAKGGQKHFMLKEILEQPTVITNTLTGRVIDGPEPRVHLGGLRTKIEIGGRSMTIGDFLQNHLERVVITACGTSWHAGLIGERMLEALLGLPVKVVYASEFITGFTPINNRTLVITISQSGETKDTIEAARKAKRQGAIVWNISNVVGSTLSRVADSGVYLHVGPEIGVASTKAFTAQIVALALFTLKLVELRNPAWVTDTRRQEIANALLALPAQMERVVADAKHARDIAFQFACRSRWLCRCFKYLAQSRTPRSVSWLMRLIGASNALYLGRGYNFHAALEGALKLKEISYVHADGYAAGEMKHGSIALIDKRMPVVVIVPEKGEDEETYARVISNIEEVAARKGRVILIASEGDSNPEELRCGGKVERILWIPKTLAMLTPVLASIHLQLLAYHIAEMRGCPIDQPRNLAKSVTVE
ncbi:MAG: glutamine--fructose-6-phosphate transaminase (isomerizing) [Patescibacteria group bacterium]|nr:glutamine--fructose-6-phosphate transaminase (isomerizing) [Patescibacteria group bacterium]